MRGITTKRCVSFYFLKFPETLDQSLHELMYFTTLVILLMLGIRLPHIALIDRS